MINKCRKYTHNEVMQKFMAPGISFILAGITGFFASTWIAEVCLKIFGRCFGSTQVPKDTVDIVGTLVCIEGLLCAVCGIALLLYAFYLEKGMRHGK